MPRLLRTEVRAALAAVLVARLAVNGGYRIAYPFLPEIARGLGVSLGVVGGLLALRAFAGLAAPLVPRMAESHGRRAIMLIGIVATALGSLAVAAAPAPPATPAAGPLAPSLLVAGAGFLVIGLSKPLFDVPMQSWFGARVPYARRGRVLGITELAWALSLALALPAGFLIAATSWRAPFLLVAALAVVGLLVVVRLMASDRPTHTERRALRLTGPVVGLLAVVVLFRFAAEVLFVVYGAWLEDDFGLSVTAIGVFTMLVVGSELAGEGAVVAFADRLGLRRTILIGLIGSGVVYAALGLVGSELPAAVAAVVGWFVLFEVTIVATIPFATELAGEARDRLLAMVATVAVAIGGAAALIGPQLYARGGIGLCGLVAAGAVLVAAAILALRVPSPTTD